MKILKIIGWILCVLVVGVGLFFTKAYYSTQQRMNKKYDFSLSTFELKSDSSILQEGLRLVKTKDCGGCHGNDLSGKLWLDDPLLAKIVAPNLTKGKGGLSHDYSTNDWLRSLKHGLKRDSTAMLIMPSHEFTQLANEDLNAIIAYCSSLKPIDNQLPQTSIGILGYILTELGTIPLFPAENIDHRHSNIEKVARSASIEFGKYLSVSCQGCHRENMKGGSPVAPGFPDVADISSTGNLGHWSEQQFISTLKTGITPEGKVLKQEEMPYTAFSHYTETELTALYIYLKSL
jgi:mono/diheme cytochrome c family protein